MECPVCEYPRIVPGPRLSDRLFRTCPDEFQLFECRSCGLLFQDYEAVKPRLAEFYPQGYWWHGDGKVSLLEDRYRSSVLRRDQLKFLQEAISSKYSPRLLDIGCGNGLFVGLAREAGYESHGIEMSQEAVAIAVGNGITGVQCGTEETIIESGETFDVLTLHHVLEHVPDPFPYLKRIQKLLRRPGGIIVQVPNRASIQAGLLGGRWYGLDCPRHLTNFTEYSLLHALGRAGFRVQKVSHYSLRDNAPALVSSLLPSLDPIARRVKNARSGTRPSGLGRGLSSLLYFGLFLLAQPFALAESAVGRGATIKVFATLED